MRGRLYARVSPCDPPGLSASTAFFDIFVTLSHCLKEWLLVVFMSLFFCFFFPP